MENANQNKVKRFFQKIGNFFSMLARKIGGGAKRLNNKVIHHKLYTLVVMQLKDKWNISFKTDKKGTLFKLVGYLIVFVAITYVVHLVMDLSASMLGIFVSPKIPVTAMIPLIAIVSFFEVLSILFGMTRTLYFGKDNVVLVTYPVKSDYLFLSKIIVYYLDALKKATTLLLPILISFGWIYNMPFYFYVWVILMTLIYVAVLVLICGLISVPTYYILRILDRFKIIKIIVGLLIAGALIYGAIALINVIPSNINMIDEYVKFSVGLNTTLNWISENIFVSRAISNWLIGVRNALGVSLFSTYSWAVTLSMLGIIAVLVLGNAFLSKPFYHKMIASSNTRASGRSRRHKNHRSYSKLSVFKFELIRILRDEKQIVASLICLTIMPLVTLVVNRVYNSFITQPRGDLFIFIANFVLIFIVAFTHNVSTSYIYSKDGPSWTVNKTMPVDPRMSLFVRLFYNFVISCAIIIPSSIIFLNNFKPKGYDTVLFILTLIALSVFHMVFSASYDFSHSKNKDKADIGSEIISSHELVSLGIGFLITVVSMLFYVIFVFESSTVPQTRLLVLSAVLMTFEILFFLRKIRLTYQEN